MMPRFINGLNCSFIYAKTVVKRKIYGNLRQTVSKTSKTGRFFAIFYGNFKIGYIFFQMQQILCQIATSTVRPILLAPFSTCFLHLS